ncbi:Pkinase-domain-containing protein [Pseudovirgaria hyperparasitica]|uniref:mitogen-activated protein kinase n=1 Tax=Pseudovirgaria hyperparasitica TaxID=470096 RepID=A0A6A6W8H9_9PEZI|nr:Pkinase-domain-containing protein [Pseudovirgaria hyperparasitica]KAF2758196.1 Pkinase-domain-containing protein [Pseudovirgaria hyperparasitica]
MQHYPPDAGRQYLPPPPGPPPPTATPGPPIGIHIPPPPPRQLGGTSHGMLPPPPQTAYWNQQRPTYPQGQTYNPQLFSNYQHNQFPPPPPPPEQQPLTSATYIPYGESFGPGVGIPPLHTPSRYQDPTYFREDYSANTDSSRNTGGTPNTADTTITTPDFYNGDNRSYNNVPPTPPSHPSNSRMPINVGLAQNYQSSGPPTATVSNPQPHRQPTYVLHPRRNDSTARQGNTPVSPSGQGAEWPMDRVVQLLIENDFSRDWQETFKHMNLFGAQFLEIGRGHGSKTNVAMMHQVLYPKLAQQCTSSGTGWDQERERHEGRRLRRLVRSIVENTPQSHIRIPGRQTSQYLTSAGTDGTLENSPNLRNQNFTPTTAGDGEQSPGFGMPAPGQSPAGIVRRYSTQQRNVSTPSNHQSQQSSDFEDASSEKNLGPWPKPQSPSGSGDHSAGGSFNHRDQLKSASPQQSPGLTAVRLQNNSSNGAPSNRYYQPNRRNSSESNPVVTQNLAGGPTSAKASKDHRNGHPTSHPMEQSMSNELPSATSQHKFSLQKIFSRRNKPAEPSPDESSLDGESSPNQARTTPYGSSFLKNSSDVSLNDRPTSNRSEDKGISRTRSKNRDIEPRRFAFVTPDGWNYRLIDITDCQSASAMKEAICDGLGIPFTMDVSYYLTSPGQTEHDDPLSDKKLLRYRESHGDPVSGLKILVSAPNYFPHSAGSGLAFAHGGLTSPFGRATFEKPRDDALFNRVRGTHDPDSPSGTRSGESTLVPENKVLRSNLGKNGDISAEPSSARSKTDRTWDVGEEREWTEVERRDLSAESERYRQEAQRKQDHYLQERRQKLKRESTIDSPGIRGPGIINFDERRDSPYEDSQKPSEEARTKKKLVPQREPPPVPPDSSTLIKANSLTKRSSGSSENRKSGDSAASIDPNRRKAIPSSVAGLSHISAALAGAGNVGALVGAPERAKNNSRPSSSQSREETSAKSRRPGALASIEYNSQSASARGTSPGGSPRSPGFTMSKGNVAFKIPDYEDDFPEDLALDSKPALTLQTQPNPTVARLREPQPRLRTPDISPSSSHPPRNALSRESSRISHYVGTIDFQESHVPFATNSTDDLSDSDEESDDGLFAMPLAKTAKTMPPTPSKSKAAMADDFSSQRPSLTLETSKSKLAFESPERTALTKSASTDGTEIESKQSALPSSSIDTPHEEPDFGRRGSTFTQNIWANRPPAEALVEHLDEFFPNVNLDQSIEDEVNSPPSSPLGGGAEASNKSSTNVSRATTPMSSADDEGDVLGSNESTLKRGDTYKTVAQRNIRRSGGLNRSKSIREVVKGAYQHPDKRSMPGPARISTIKSGDITRRKSTKMFNAKIEQVKPSRQSKLIPLDTIPQDQIPVPQRQQTFKWVKGQLIGKGTFGRVYLGMNLTTGELLAVKQVEVKQQAAGQDKEKMRELVKSLDIEIDTMQHLDHPNIVQYLGCERKEMSISIFLEYISGGSVGSCLRKHGRFEEKIVSSLTRQTLLGLAYLHGQGILHRDLKADNILLDLDGTCKISDFGISKKTDNIYGNDVSNSMQGSVFWMAPEVIRAQGEGYSAKIDIWSLGCVVLEMFAGRRPWSKEEAIGAIYKLGSLNQAPPIPDDVSSQITPQALSFMYDCFTINTMERPTAETLLRAPFCFSDPHYNFLDTALYAKIRDAYN